MKRFALVVLLAACGGKAAKPAPASPPVAASTTPLTPDAILTKIQASYMDDIQRCYKSFLKKDATAQGRIALTLPIVTGGRVDKGSASGFAKEVDTCIDGLIASWTFPPPKADETFRVTLQLVPE